MGNLFELGMEVILLKTHRKVTIRVVKLDSISTVKRKKQGSRMLDEGKVFLKSILPKW